MISLVIFLIFGFGIAFMYEYWIWDRDGKRGYRQ